MCVCVCVSTVPYWKKTLKLCSETAGSWLTSSDQLHTQHGLTSSRYVLKRLVAAHFKLVLAGFYTSVYNSTIALLWIKSWSVTDIVQTSVRIWTCVYCVWYAWWCVQTHSKCGTCLGHVLSLTWGSLACLLHADAKIGRGRWRKLVCKGRRMAHTLGCKQTCNHGDGESLLVSETSILNCLWTFFLLPFSHASFTICQSPPISHKHTLTTVQRGIFPNRWPSSTSPLDPSLRLFLETCRCELWGSMSVVVREQVAYSQVTQYMLTVQIWHYSLT